MSSVLDLKLRNLGGYVRALLAPNNVAAGLSTWSTAYVQRNFGKNSGARPLFHIMVAVGVLGYVLEYSHIKKEAMAKYH